MSLITRLCPGNTAQAEYDEAAGAPGAIFCERRASMTGRASQLRAPNRLSSKAVRKHLGGVVLSKTGLVIIVGRKLRCHATFSNGGADPLSISFHPHGMTIDIDVASAFPPDGKGELSLEVRSSLPDATLAELPGREVKAKVSEADLLTMTRWI